MAYTCRIYLNSGFNSVNLPDSPSLLNSVSHIDLPALQILQSRDLRYVDVKVSSYEAIKNADYCKIDDWFYFIDGIQMLAVDTARITIYADYLTSAGGVSSLHILDGITSRVHVASDQYGEWTEEDPYMAPSQQPELQIKRQGASQNYTTVVKSTLNLSAMGGAGGTKIGVTYTDTITGETVTVPSTVINDGTDDTTYTIQGSIAPMGVPGESKTKLFDVDYQAVKKGLQEVNDLGTTGAISAQVLLPLSYVTPTIAPDGHLVSAEGKDDYTALVGMPYEYSGANNKKIDYSGYTPFGILSASGDRKEFLPHQIYVPGLTQPVLRTIADPRTDGKPYFRFSAFNGDVSTEGFFDNAVEGMPWKQVPLVYEGANGAALIQLQHNQTMKTNAFGAQQRIDQIYEARDFAVLGLAAKGAGGVLGAMGGGDVRGGMIGQGIESIGGMWLAGEVANKAAEDVKQKYELDKQMELQQYHVKTSVYTPVVQFPFSAELFRDLYNNPCIVYRYKYTAYDISRIDKILTMYGYKVTKALEATDFTNRSKFNYVEAGISVGSLPKWHADGIAAQISNGVRIWHVLPNNAHYTNNPIAT